MNDNHDETFFEQTDACPRCSELSCAGDCDELATAPTDPPPADPVAIPQDGEGGAS